MVDNGQAFVDMLRARSDLYIHNHVMIPFGDDFNFQVLIRPAAVPATLWGHTQGMYHR